jgi:hypothetical protein
MHGKVIATARRGRGRDQANCALRTMAVTVLDSVCDGFSGRDEHLHRLIGSTRARANQLRKAARVGARW